MSSPKQRHRSRKLVLQAIYQWQMTDHKPLDLEMQFREVNDFSKIDEAYFSTLLNGIINKVIEIDAIIEPILDRKISDLNPVELAVLRLATFELKNEFDVPYKVVINEALELAKTFGAEEGYKYVNAVLDKLAIGLRPLEFKANKR